MVWTLELASYLDDAPWPANKVVQIILTAINVVNTENLLIFYFLSYLSSAGCLQQSATG